jgi:hypothetical protein
MGYKLKKGPFIGHSGPKISKKSYFWGIKGPLFTKKEG